MREREYIEVSFTTYRESQAFIRKACSQGLVSAELTLARLKELNTSKDVAAYEAMLDVHNLCQFIARADKDWMIVISKNPKGTTIDWLLGHDEQDLES